MPRRILDVIEVVLGDEDVRDVLCPLPLEHGNENAVYGLMADNGQRRAPGEKERAPESALHALHEHGVRIPQDVSLVGFGDMPAMDNMFPPLTTVRPGFEQLGVAAMRETLYLLGAGEENSFGSSQHGVGLVSAQMVNRSSLGPVRRR